MTEQIPGHRLATIHPAAIPGALRLHQDAIATLQRTLRHELTKLQAEEAILKLMVRREVQQLRGKRRREASDEEGEQEGGEDTQQHDEPEEEGQEGQGLQLQHGRQGHQQEQRKLGLDPGQLQLQAEQEAGEGVAL